MNHPFLSMTLCNDLILSQQVALGGDLKLPLLAYITTANRPASIVDTLGYITYPIIPNTILVKVLVKSPFFVT